MWEQDLYTEEYNLLQERELREFSRRIYVFLDDLTLMKGSISVMLGVLVLKADV